MIMAGAEEAAAEAAAGGTTAVKTAATATGSAGADQYMRSAAAQGRAAEAPGREGQPGRRGPSSSCTGGEGVNVPRSTPKAGGRCAARSYRRRVGAIFAHPPPKTFWR